MTDEEPVVVERFQSFAGGRYLAVEVRARGHGASLPLVLVANDVELELTERDMEWLMAIAPRVLARARKAAA